MFLPIGDEPNPKTTPVATYGLIALNVYVWVAICWPKTSIGVDPLDPNVLNYLATMRRATDLPTPLLLQETSAYELLTWMYGFRPSQPSFVTLFTSLFLHGGWMHVLGNMLFLWIFGDNIEDRIGSKKFLALYFASGVVATLFYAAFRLTSPLPLIGASGAISGILGAYFVWFGHNRVRVLMVLVIFIQIIHVPARWVLGFYLVFENLLPFLWQAAPASSTAYGAHIGGFFAGGLFALAYSHREATGAWGNGRAWLHELVGVLRSRAPKEASAHRPTDGATQSPPSARGVAVATAAGNFEEALGGYSALDEAQRALLDAGTCFILADVLTDQGNFGLAAQLLKRYLSDHSNGPRVELARGHLRLGLLQLRGLALPFAAREHFLAVLDLLPHSDEAQAASEALSSMD